MMAVVPLNRPRLAAWRVLLALVCVLLILVAGTAQAFHFHADGMDTHSDCSLCVTAHMGVQAAAVPAVAHVAAVMPATVFAQQPGRPVSARLDFSLFTRPPPAA